MTSNHNSKGGRTPIPSLEDQETRKIPEYCGRQSTFPGCWLRARGPTCFRTRFSYKCAQKCLTCKPAAKCQAVRAKIPSSRYGRRCHSSSLEMNPGAFLEYYTYRYMYSNQLTTYKILKYITWREKPSRRYSLLLRSGNSQPKILPSGQKALFPYTRYSEIRLLYIRSVRSRSTTKGSGGLQHPIPIRRRTFVSITYNLSCKWVLASRGRLMLA